MKRHLNKILTYLFFGVLPLGAGTGLTQGGQYLYYKYMPIDHFIKIEKVEANQLNDETVLYVLYRDVKQPLRGFFDRTALCIESDPDRTVVHDTKDIFFDKKPENKAEIKLPLSLFDPTCHTYQFRVQYIAYMPNGYERQFPIYYSNIFTVVFPGEVIDQTKPQVRASAVPDNRSTNFTQPKAKSIEDKSNEPQKIEVKSESRSETKQEEQKGLIETLTGIKL